MYKEIHIINSGTNDPVDDLAPLSDEDISITEYSDIQTYFSTIPDKPENTICIIYLHSHNESQELLKHQQSIADLLKYFYFIVVSNVSDIDIRVQAFHSGIHRYLIAPQVDKKLQQVVEKLLNDYKEPPYKIVVVDDDILTLKIVQECLSRNGMEVYTETDCMKILSLLEITHPDVIILDLYLTDALGTDIAALIREVDDYINTPILFLSSEKNRDIQLKALQYGADDFLEKPIDVDELLATVKARAVRSRRIQSVNQQLKLSLYERERELLAVNKHAIVSIADNAGNIIYANDIFCEISGYKREELIGQNHRVIKSDKHPPEFYQNLWDTISSGNIWQGLVCNLSKNGEYYWVESTIVPFLDNDDNPYQYVSIRTNVTDIIVKEMQLKEAQEIAQLGSWTINRVSGEVKWSDEMYSIYDINNNSDNGSISMFSENCHPDDLLTLTQAIGSVHNQTEIDTMYRVVHTDDSVHYIQMRTNPDLTTNVMLLTGTCQDVTDQIQTELVLIAAREEAEAASRAKSEFLSSMSHELRTPLNAIIGFSQMMRSDPDISDDYVENLDEILAAGKHLLNLINDILDLSKVESGNVDLSLEPVEVRPVIDEVNSLLKMIADKKNVTIQYSIQSNIVIRADHTRFMQVVINLVSNAIKYNVDNGSVTLSLTHTGNEYVRLSVEDSGIGIPDDKLDLLFQPFSRLIDKDSPIEGTGIGLTISKRLVELMGGTIGATSEQGQGSVFWIELPSESLSNNYRSETDNLVTDIESVVNEKKTILYIEDNPANLKLVARVLNRWKNVHLLTAHTGKIGLDLASAYKPDIILLDIHMPNLNGYEVLKYVKSNKELQSIPVIAITAHAMPTEISRGLSAGFDEYLTKPLNIDIFNEAINKYIKQD